MPHTFVTKPTALHDQPTSWAHASVNLFYPVFAFLVGVCWGMCYSPGSQVTIMAMCPFFPEVTKELMHCLIRNMLRLVIFFCVIAFMLLCLSKSWPFSPGTLWPIFASLQHFQAPTFGVHTHSKSIQIQIQTQTHSNSKFIQTQSVHVFHTQLKLNQTHNTAFWFKEVEKKHEQTCWQQKTGYTMTF